MDVHSSISPVTTPRSVSAARILFLASRSLGFTKPVGCTWTQRRRTSIVMARLAISRKAKSLALKAEWAVKGSPSLFHKMSLLWCNCNWPQCTGTSSQREDKGGCRAGRLLACGLVNPTTNKKTTKENGTMTKAPPGPTHKQIQLNLFVCSTRVTLLPVLHRRHSSHRGSVRSV